MSAAERREEIADDRERQVERRGRRGCAPTGAMPGQPSEQRADARRRRGRRADAALKRTRPK